MLTGETVLITGGTGSFGRAFIAHVLATEPTCQVVSLSRNAEMRYRLERAHLEAVEVGRLRVVPGDVRQVSDLADLADFGITTAIHAAAEKHIGTGEKFQRYTHDVIVNGTRHVLAFARTVKARVLALSTDKACDPINYYGQCKAEAERLVIDAGGSLVRYGNVVASSGSVVPLFLEQRKSGVLTVTDRRMTRFAMPLEPGSNIPSAVEIVLDALASMRGGEIFVPAIPSHRVQDLAKAIGADCRIEEIGIRPGEKLHEALISPREAERAWERFEGGWVILPTPDVVWPRGRRVPAGFSYSSDQRPLLVRWAA